MSALAAGMVITTGICMFIPMALALPHRHRAPFIVRFVVWVGILVGILIALLSISMLLGVTA